jgi:predicted N-formylglutamate amidohydrolase
MSHDLNSPAQAYVLSENPEGSSSVVVVCEHASHFIPDCFDGLGLSQQARKSHAAWDPGAMAVATRVMLLLDAALIASDVSRLVYDCNRPPTAQDAMPERSEIYDIPGNKNLTQADRDARIETFYRPFQSALRQSMKSTENPILVTIHSFTPVYHGALRSAEIGVLHDSDTRLADAMLQMPEARAAYNVQRNQPYGIEDGVTHTLQEHAIKEGHLNVMLEIRNDLIETQEQQVAIADMLASWIENACAYLKAPGVVKCQA